MPKQTLQQGKRWYVIHTYSGYEENVKRNLEQRIESMDMEDKIFAVLIPTEKKIKIKNGKRKVVTEKIFPGYVVVEMIVDDNSWYVVRNTPNVTGFIGSGTTPTPVSAPIPSLVTPPSQPSPIEKPTPKPKISFSIPETSSPSIAPTITPTPTSSEPQTPPPMIPKISFPSLSKPSTTTPSNLLGQTLGKREEDRATGIAILRKQMLTELKKIRSVVSEDQR